MHIASVLGVLVGVLAVCNFVGLSSLKVMGGLLFTLRPSAHRKTIDQKMYCTTTVDVALSPGHS